MYHRDFFFFDNIVKSVLFHSVNWASPNAVSLWWGACSHLPCHAYRVAKAPVLLSALPSHVRQLEVFWLFLNKVRGITLSLCIVALAFLWSTLYLAGLWSHSWGYCINISEALIYHRNSSTWHANKGKSYFQHLTKLQEVYLWSFGKEGFWQM